MCASYTDFANGIASLKHPRHDHLATSREWVALNPEERRRRAVLAATEKDLAVLWSLTQAHLTRQAGERSLHTLRLYRVGLRRWLDFTSGQAVNVLHPDIEHADLWLRELEGEGLKPASVRVYLAGARHLYAALRWTKATRDDPFVDSKPQRDRGRPQDKRRPYTDESFRTLLDAAPLEMQVLLSLAGTAGLRVSEITALRWGDLDLDASLVTVLGKGRKTRVVNLPSSLVGLLRELGPGPTDQLVIGRSPEAARKRVRTLCERAGVTYQGIHAFRHTAGTSLRKAGFDLQDVAEHLGHSDVQTARVYAKWADEKLRDHFSRQ